MNYNLREDLKEFGRRYGKEDFIILSQYLRSLEQVVIKEHPDFEEYKSAYKSGDKKWLPKGKSYVNIAEYKREKSNDR